MNKKIVSIIIVNWNGEKILKNCIKSIKKNCKNEMYEIIVVDNNSSDNSVQSIKNNFPDVKIIENKKNEGFAKANNIGFLEAQGEYILLLNSDTLFLDDNISITTNFMNENKHISMLGVKLLNENFSLQKSCFKLPTLLSYSFEYILRYRYSQNHNYDVKNEVECISGAYMLIRKSTIDELGLFDEQYYFYQEDTDLCKKFKTNNKIIFYIPFSEVIHLGGASTATVKAKMLIQMHRNRYIYIKKYFSGNTLIVFDLITKVGLISDFISHVIKLIIKKIKYKDFLERLNTYPEIFLLGREIK
ncbi:glycosyltransferase family 2 protein [Exiguobacterium chiriqhucha]|uniref:glycosyltransferase family 2 protein n=1 Tax=Exiguobacterium chiriqhucha TaxID=1385984 RepID=UPI0038BE194A